MGQHLFTVEATASIKRKGLLAYPGLMPKQGEVVRIGDVLELRRPDGVVLTTHIAGIAMLSRGPDEGREVLLPLAKEDVPIGTEVWLL